MPPRARITKEMIVDVAFEVARESGAENINTHTVSQKLGCSTKKLYEKNELTFWVYVLLHIELVDRAGKRYLQEEI